MNDLRKNLPLQWLTVWVLIQGLILLPGSLQANPYGEIVIDGNVTFEDLGSTLKILQESNKSIIHWEGFSIASGEKTIFEMPSSASASLNRVTGSGGSFLDGLLQSNGAVWLINPNGIVVGPNGFIDTQASVLSTLDISNANFLTGGDLNFAGSSAAPILNFGRIQAAEGDVYVFATTVENHGSIGSVDGRVVMAGGNNILVEQGRDGNIFVNGTVGFGHVLNNGEIVAPDVTLAARNNNSFAVAVQNNGTVRASTVDRSGGRIRLIAEGGSGVVNTGTLNANGETAGGSVSIQGGDIAMGGVTSASSSQGAGGSVSVVGRNVSVDPLARVEARGATGGGAITIGSSLEGTETVTLGNGSVVDAGSSDGMGGSVDISANGVVLSQGAVNAGSTLGNGGSVQISGGDVLISQFGSVDASGGVAGGSVGLAAQNTLVVDGSVSATGEEGDGGLVALTGTDILISQTGAIRASGKNGGTVLADATQDIFVAGQVDASGTDGQGGRATFNAGEDLVVAMTGRIDASGSNGGGTVNLSAGDQADILGTVTATGGTGAGGSIGVTGRNVFVAPTALIDAGGASGGIVSLDALESMEVAGTVRAIGQDGSGGYVAITGDEVSLAPTAVIDVSGATDGGLAQIGGGFRGKDGALRNATNTTIAAGSVVRANGGNGNGGNVVVFADGSTFFEGLIEARSDGGVGNGGLVEVSGKENVQIGGFADLGSTGGKVGTFVIDPSDFLVDTLVNGGNITGAALATQLGNSDVVIFTDPLGVGSGNIVVNQAVEWASDSSLAMLASGSLEVRFSVRNAGGSYDSADPDNAAKVGTGNVFLVAGWDGMTGLGTDANEDGIVDPIASDLLDVLPALNSGTYFSTNFGANRVGDTYAEDDRGSILIGSTNGNRDVTVGSRYGETGLAGFSVTLIGDNADDDSVMIGFRDNGRVGTFNTGTGVLTPNANYWWFAINPDSALPGQGIAIEAPTGTQTFQTSAIASDVVTGSDAVTFMSTGGGALSNGRVAAGGGLVAELATVRRPEDHFLNAQDLAASESARASAIRGNITVNAAGSVLLVAGEDANAYVQIGHVGSNLSPRFFRDNDQDGLPGPATQREGSPETDGAHVIGSNINVSAGLSGSGILLMQSNVANPQDGGYTMIGHGGLRTAGIREGDINVFAEDGIFLNGGRGNGSLSAIGHGSSLELAAQRHHQYRGDITVLTPSGSISLESYEFALDDFSQETRAHTGIGHFFMAAFDNNRNLVRPGRHRDLQLSTNHLLGSVNVEAGGDVTLQAGNRPVFSSHIGHSNFTGGTDTQAGGGGTGLQFDFNGNGNLNQTAVTVDESTILADLDGDGVADDPVDLNGNGIIDIAENVFELSSIQHHASSGALTGGKRTGSLKMSSQSLSGTSLDGVNVTSGGNVSLMGGGQGTPLNANLGAGFTGNRRNQNPGPSWAQIGLGGRDGRTDLGINEVTVDNGAFIGTTVTTGGDVSVNAAGSVSLEAGRQDFNFAMIGNGGDNMLSSLTELGFIAGDVSVRAGGSISVLGGQASSLTDITSNPDIVASINALEAANLSAVPVVIDDLFWTANRNFAQIGNGGYNADGAGVFGDVTVVTTSGDVVVRGGTGNNAYGMIGLGGGGYGNNRGPLNMTSPLGTGPLQGAGRADDPSEIVVRTDDGNISVLGGAHDDALDAAGNFTGRFAMIGAGGQNSTLNGFVNIDVLAGSLDGTAGNVTVQGGEHALDFAQIGIGGQDVNFGGDTTDNVDYALQGNIEVDAAGQVMVIAGQGYNVEDDPASSLIPGVTLENAFAMIGHGGTDVGNSNRTNTLGGTIEVNQRLGGTVSVVGGDQRDAFAAIGHGITSAASNYAVLSGSDISVFSSGALTLQGGDRINDNSGVDVVNFGNWAQIGHFMKTNSGVMRVGTSDILVEALGPISLFGGGGNGAHAMIGHGGNIHLGGDATPNMDADGDITVVSAGDILLDASEFNDSTGGSEANLANAGGQRGFAQIGHGGAGIGSLIDGFQGNIDVRAAGNISLESGLEVDDGTGAGGAPNLQAALDAYAKIGHGDFAIGDSSGSQGANAGGGFRSGDISVAAGENLTLTGAQIGHVAAGFSGALATDGNTVVASSRNDPSGAGIFTASELARSSTAAVESSLSSGLSGQLRLYMPDRSDSGGLTLQNQIGEGTRLNGYEYEVPAVAKLRDDELEDAEFSFTTVDGLPSGSFAAVPAGGYSLALGNFTIYYGAGAPGIIVPGGGGGGTDVSPGRRRIVVPPVLLPVFDTAVPEVVIEPTIFPNSFPFVSDSVKLDIYDRSEEAIDPSFFSFMDWRDSQGSGVNTQYWVRREPGLSSVENAGDAPASAGPAGPSEFQVFPINRLQDWANGQLGYEEGVGLVSTFQPQSGSTAPAPGSADPFSFDVPGGGDDEARRRAEQMQDDAPPSSAPAMDDPFGSRPSEDPFGMPSMGTPETPAAPETADPFGF